MRSAPGLAAASKAKGPGSPLVTTGGSCNAEVELHHGGHSKHRRVVRFDWCAANDDGLHAGLGLCSRSVSLEGGLAVESAVWAVVVVVDLPFLEFGVEDVDVVDDDAVEQPAELLGVDAV